PARRGMNAYVWDLRVAPYTPVADTIRYVSQVPYRVAPGTYTVHLSYKGQTLAQRLEIAADPRHERVTALQWAAQQQLLAQLRSLVDDIHHSANDMRAITQQTQALLRRAAGAGGSAGVERSGRELIARINRWEEQVPQPKLPNDVEDYVSFPSRLLSTPVLSLIAMVDQPPPVTAAAEAQARELQARWSALRDGMARIKAGELATFEAKVRQAGLPGELALWSPDSPPPSRISDQESARRRADGS